MSSVLLLSKILCNVILKVLCIHTCQVRFHARWVSLKMSSPCLCCRCCFYWNQVENLGETLALSAQSDAAHWISPQLLRTRVFDLPCAPVLSRPWLAPASAVPLLVAVSRPPFQSFSSPASTTLWLSP